MTIEYADEILNSVGKSLNPCSNGMTIELFAILVMNMGMTVLILVLME